jgi:hypothetical protein
MALVRDELGCCIDQKWIKRMSFFRLYQTQCRRSTKTNRAHATNPKGKWSSESLKTTMDAMERGITYLQGTNKF